MGIGREVADAYIEVHGDLSKFRRSLSKATSDGRKAGMDLADSMSAGFDKRAEKQFTQKWNGVLDALHSNKKVDWDRLVGTFDAKGFPDAKSKINSFLAELQKEGVVTDQEFQRARKAIKSTMDTMEAQHKQSLREAEDQKTLREKELAFRERTRQAIKAATEEQKRYNKSFAGMFQNNRLAGLEKDFRSITAAMSDMDWSKFTKGEENLNTVTTRIREVIKHMQDAGRISGEEGDRIVTSVRKHIIEEERRRGALRLTAEETRNAKDAQDRYNKSLAGMMDAAKLKALENGYKKIAAALANQDWGPVSKDFGNMRTFTRYVTETSEELRRTGKIGDAEFERINNGVRDARRNTREWNVEFGKSRTGMGLMGKASSAMQSSWKKMDGTVKLVLTSIVAAAGPIATVLSGAAAAGTALVSSLGMALAAAIPLAGATVALGTGIALAMKSMDSMKASFPLIQQSIDRMSESWTAQAEAFGAAWGASLGNLLDSFATQLASYDFGTPLGQAFAVITDSFNNVVNGPAFAAFMGAMTTDLPAAVGGLGTGFAGLFSGLLSLMAGAAPVAKALGEDFAGWGTKIAASLEKARESGKLNEIFEKARESLLAVFDLAGSVGSALGTMFMLGADTGNRMLTSLAGIVDKFNEWMQSEDGRAKMIEWFESGERIMRSLAPLAIGLGSALGALVTPNSIAQVERLMTSLGDTLPVVGELLSAVSDLGILNTFADALGLVGDFIAPLLPAFKELTGTMGAGMSASLEALSPLFTALGEALAPVVQMFADNLQTILPNIPPLLEAIVSGLTPLIGAFGDILGFLGPLISGFVGFVASAIPFEALGQLIQGAFGLITGALQILMGLFTLDLPLVMEGARLIFESFILVIESVWMAIQNAFNFITGIFTTFVAFLGEIFAPIGEFIAGVWNGIVEGAMAFGTTVGTWFSETWASIAEGISTAWQGMLDTISDFLARIGEWINTKLDEFWQKFDAIFPGMRELAGEEMEQMKETLTKIFTDVQDQLTKILDAIKAYLGLKWDEIKDYASLVWNALKAYAAVQWEAIKTAVMEPINILKTWLSTKWNEIKTNISQVWQSIKDYFSLKWAEIKYVFNNTTDSISNLVRIFGEAVRKYVVDPIQKMASGVSAGWNVITNLFNVAMDRIGNFIRNGTENVLRFFITLPNKIISFLANLPNMLQDAGRNMMEGMVRGITNMAANLLQSAMNAVKGAVDGVKNFLGIRSPSRLFAEIGGYMGEGMAIGLEQSAGQAADAAKAMAAATTAEFSSSKMYTAGQDAAAGLAKGLKDNKSAVSAAFSALQTGLKPVGIDLSGSAGGSSSKETAVSAQKIVNIHEGAVRIETKTTDPKMSADMLLDSLVHENAL